MARHRLLISVVLTAALVLPAAPLLAQQPAAAGVQAPACADPLHASGPCPAAPGSQVARGDAARGKAVYEGKGACQSCHRIAGIGSRIAPDLTAIGAILSAEALTKVLVDPTAALRPAATSVRAVTKDGTTIIGLRLNEDRHTVQLIDERERLRSLAKSDFREFAILTTARMPLYREKLTPQDIADVVAYLSALKTP